MSALILSEAQRRDIQSLKEYAEAHKYSFDDYMKYATGQGPGPGDKKEHSRIIPLHYRVVYSIEALRKEDQDAGRYARHMSISVSKENKFPNQIVIETIMEMLGFASKIGTNECNLWADSLSVNVVEYLYIDITEKSVG